MIGKIIVNSNLIRLFIIFGYTLLPFASLAAELNTGEMAKLQRFLILQGNDIGRITGKANDETHAVVLQFLEDNEINAGEDPYRQAYDLIVGQDEDTNNSNELTEIEDPDAGGELSESETKLETPSSLSQIDANTQYVSRKFGIPMWNGHLVVPPDFNKNDWLSKTDPQLIRRRWFRFWTVNNYLTKPSEFDDTIALLDYLLTPKRKVELFKKYNLDAGKNHVDLFPLIMSRMDEFDKQDFHEYIKNEYAPKLGKPIHGSLRVLSINALYFSKFDIAKSSFSISGMRGQPFNFIQFSGAAVARWTGKNYRKRVNNSLDGLKINKTIQIPPKIARQVVKTMQRTHGEDRRGFFGFFGKLDLTNEEILFRPSSVILSYDPSLRVPIVPVSIETISTNPKAEAQAEASRKKLISEEKERQNKLAVKNERIRQRVKFEPRIFDIMGARLGMDIYEAKKTLRTALKDYNPKFFTTTSGGGLSLSPCEIEIGRLNRSIESVKLQAVKAAQVDQFSQISKETRERIIEQVRTLKDGTSADCVYALQPIFKLAFRLQVDYGGGLLDHLAIYESGLPGENKHVVGIVRDLDDREKTVNFAEALKQKYGAATYNITGSDNYWFATSKVHNQVRENEAFRKTCVARTPWPVVGIKLSSTPFQAACGPYVGRLLNSMFLVDTDYVASAREQNTTLSKKKAKKAKKKIKF